MREESVFFRDEAGIASAFSHRDAGWNLSLRFDNLVAERTFVETVFCGKPVKVRLIPTSL